MYSPQSESIDLSEFLEEVRKRSQGEGPLPAVMGKAVRADDKEVHIATRTGILAVRIDAIKHISRPAHQQSDIVILHVRDLTALRPVLPVEPLGPSIPRLGMAPRPFNPNFYDLRAETRTNTTSPGECTESGTPDPIGGINVDDVRCHEVEDDSYDW